MAKYTLSHSKDWTKMPRFYEIFYSTRRVCKDVISMSVHGINDEALIKSSHIDHTL